MKQQKVFVIKRDMSGLSESWDETIVDQIIEAGWHIDQISTSASLEHMTGGNYSSIKGWGYYVLTVLASKEVEE